MADDTATAGLAGKTAGKTGTFFQKHKTTIFVIGGIAVVLVLYLVLRGSGLSSASTDPNAATGIGPVPGNDPGAPGAPGAPGTPGSRGKRGRRGRRGHQGHKGPKGTPLMQASMTPTAALSAKTVHYNTKPGETSASVALKHGQDVSNLHAMNPHLGSNGVMPGQRVRVR